MTYPCVLSILHRWDVIRRVRASHLLCISAQNALKPVVVWICAVVTLLQFGQAWVVACY